MEFYFQFLTFLDGLKKKAANNMIDRLCQEVWELRSLYIFLFFVVVSSEFYFF